MSMNVSLMKAAVSGGLTYAMFTYTMPNEPNKLYYTIGSATGSYIGDSIISILMPTYTSTGTLMDTLISSAAASGSGYLVEKVLVSGTGNDFTQTNMGMKIGVLLLSNAVSDYLINAWYAPSNTTSVTSA